MSHRRWLAGLVALGLLATTACGSRLSDEERAAAVSAGADGSGGALGPAEGTDGGSTGGDTALPTGPAGTTGSDPAGGATGGATGGADGATGAPAPGDAPAPEAACAPGSATSPGVTPTEIKVGNVSQLSGLVPKFGQTGVNGVKAYFNMINNKGGVCGRQLSLVVADDRFQAATNRAETEKLAGQVLAFVGSTSVVDDGGAPVIDSMGVADVSVAATLTRAAAENNFSPNPRDPTPGAGNGLAGIIEYFKRTEGISKPAIFYQDVATGVNQSASYKIDFEKAGIPVVATYPVAPTATNFRSQATDMKSKGIDFVITVAEVNAMANLARAFGDVGYFPKVPFYGAQVYGQKFLQVAGEDAEGTQVGLIFAVPEDGSPKMQEMKTWYERTAPGADLDFFAILSWVAADIFVTALRAAGPDPTQASILEHLNGMKEYTGDGLVAPINIADKKLTQCFQILEVRGGAWHKVFPDQGFQC